MSAPLSKGRMHPAKVRRDVCTTLVFPPCEVRGSEPWLCIARRPKKTYLREAADVTGQRSAAAGPTFRAN